MFVKSSHYRLCLFAGVKMPVITVKKCGVRFHRPAIVITYQKDGSNETHRRTMPLRNFTKKSDVCRFAHELNSNQRHEKYLKDVPVLQLEKLITLIHDKLNGLTLDESLKKNQGMDTVDPEQDLNKVDSVTLKRKKTIMEQAFEKHRRKPNDPDFKYDVEVDFDGAIEHCDWDSASSNDEF